VVDVVDAAVAGAAVAAAGPGAVLVAGDDRRAVNGAEVGQLALSDVRHPCREGHASLDSFVNLNGRHRYFPSSDA
jgi:hypothetical protein